MPHNSDSKYPACKSSYKICCDFRKSVNHITQHSYGNFAYFISGKNSYCCRNNTCIPCQDKNCPCPENQGKKQGKYHNPEIISQNEKATINPKKSHMKA